MVGYNVQAAVDTINPLIVALAAVLLFVVISLFENDPLLQAAYAVLGAACTEQMTVSSAIIARPRLTH